MPSGLPENKLPRSSGIPYLKKAYGIACWALLILGMVCPAWAKDISLDVQIQVFLKIMTYDRGIAQMKGEPFRVGFVYPDTEEGNNFFQVSKSLLEGKTIFGAEIIPLPITLDSKGKKLFSQIPKIIIISPTEETVVKAVVGFAREKKILTFATNPGLLKNDICVALTFEEDKPLINLNLNLARLAGADFQANFLKLCRILK